MKIVYHRAKGRNQTHFVSLPKMVKQVRLYPADLKVLTVVQWQGVPACTMPDRTVPTHMLDDMPGNAQSAGGQAIPV